LYTDTIYTNVVGIQTLKHFSCANEGYC